LGLPSSSAPPITLTADYRSVNRLTLVQMWRNSANTANILKVTNILLIVITCDGYNLARKHLKSFLIRQTFNRHYWQTARSPGGR